MLKEPSLPVTFNLLHVGQQTLHGRRHLPGVTEPGCIWTGWYHCYGGCSDPLIPKLYIFLPILHLFVIFTWQGTWRTHILHFISTVHNGALRWRVSNGRAWAVVHCIERHEGSTDSPALDGSQSARAAVSREESLPSQHHEAGSCSRCSDLPSPTLGVSH